MTPSNVVVYGHEGAVLSTLVAQLRAENITVEVVVPDAQDSAAGLAEKFAGARVVHNTHWPFAEATTHTVVEASLAAGCHYLDTSDEHAWLVAAGRNWHQQYADAELLLVPGLAQPFVTSEIAAQLSLETPGAASLDVLLLWQNAASLSAGEQLRRVVKANGCDTQNVQQWPLDRTLNVRVPGHSEPGIAIRSTDSLHSVWFESDTRVSQLRTYRGAPERSLVQRMLTNFAGVVEASDPPDSGAPTQTVEASIDFVYSDGPNGRTQVLIEGTCPYAATAVLHTRAAASLLAGSAWRVGFASASQAFGHRHLLEALETAGLVRPVVTLAT